MSRPSTSLRVLSRRAIALIGLAFVLVYATWIAGPYLRAIIVRDAAVTSWIAITTAPVAGYTLRPLHPGERTQADGRIATIADPRADSTSLARAQADLAQAEARAVAQAAIVLASQIELDRRAEHADDFGTTFTADLDTYIAGTHEALAFLEERLALSRTDATREVELERAGFASRRAVDTANFDVAGHERLITEARTSIARAQERIRAAKDGVFLLEDGTDGNTVFQNLSDARVRLIEAQETLVRMRAEEVAARGVAEAALLAYDKSRSTDILVAPDAMVWSLISSDGAPVQPGSPVASWVDCKVMLVDVPVSDVEAALLHLGSEAHVVIEGERERRTGEVILTRGSAGVLGSHDLAAIAKGRRPGVGQALVRIDASAADVEACVIGRAAFVDFPEVDVIDLVLARLRIGDG